MGALDIAVVGELNVDLILTGLPGFPEMGALKLAGDMSFTLGSSSAIFASNIARLGMRVGFMGKAGQDNFGDFIVQCLQSNHVDTSHIIRSSEGRTGICVCMSFPENYAMVSFPGIRETFTVDEVDFDYVKQARHMHLSSYYIQPGMRPGCPRLFRWARENGLTTSFDPDTDPAGLWGPEILDVLANVDVFLPNEREALSISGAPDVESAIAKLTQYVKVLVIKRGAKGVLAVAGGRRLEAAPFRMQVVDTTGAGDSFNAGFLYRYLNGASLEECLLWGNACGGLSTTRMGGTAGFPTRDEAQRFIEHKEIEK
jgi:sugar/nucleoside kinase (ribokinase family)